MAVSSKLRAQLKKALSSIPLGNELAGIIDAALDGLSTTGLTDLASRTAAKGASLIGTETGSLGGGGEPTTVQAALVAIFNALNDKLNTSKIVQGSVTVLAAGTSITATVDGALAGKQVIVTPAGSPGTSTWWRGAVSGTTLTVTVDQVPGTNTVFNYTIFNL